MVSPTAEDRAAVRRHHQSQGLCFVEIWVSTPLAICEQRDPKGLYQLARRGELENMTGIDSTYEPPSVPEVEIPTQSLTRQAAVQLVLRAIEPHLPPRPSSDR
jgi:adenylylsulfate kinase-like enzyme